MSHVERHNPKKGKDEEGEEEEKKDQINKCKIISYRLDVQGEKTIHTIYMRKQKSTEGAPIYQIKQTLPTKKNGHWAWWLW